ncbi:MAG TPA: TMEM175 family protein [Blastocatellia bacterium]|nr:TMEM175 family protein [Blastocatellia bacterium]
MGKGRLEAFSDGVLAIIITIMVLELKVPHGDKLHDLSEVLPVFLSYVLSFLYVGIYWNNHHHMLHASTTVSGTMLWANLHLLFWLSLFPFATAWMGENLFTPLPTAIYGIVLLMAAIAYLLLQQTIIRTQGPDSLLKKAVGRDWKGKVSLVLYLVAIVSTLWTGWVAEPIYIVGALLWLIPDRRIEHALIDKQPH